MVNRTTGQSATTVNLIDFDQEAILVGAAFPAGIWTQTSQSEETPSGPAGIRAASRNSARMGRGLFDWVAVEKRGAITIISATRGGLCDGTRGEEGRSRVLMDYIREEVGPKSDILLRLKDVYLGEVSMGLCLSLHKAISSAGGRFALCDLNKSALDRLVGCKLIDPPERAGAGGYLKVFTDVESALSSDYFAPPSR